MIFVEDTFARDELPTVKTPVDDEKVNEMEDVAPPPNIPYSTCVSTPFENPPHPIHEDTVSVPIVEDGLLNSELDATPMDEIVKKLCPVEEMIVRRFAVWFVNP